MRLSISEKSDTGKKGKRPRSGWFSCSFWGDPKSIRMPHGDRYSYWLIALSNRAGIRITDVQFPVMIVSYTLSEEARFRAVPLDELVNGVPVAALCVDKGETV